MNVLVPALLLEMVCARLANSAFAHGFRANASQRDLQVCLGLLCRFHQAEVAATSSGSERFLVLIGSLCCAKHTTCQKHPATFEFVGRWVVSAGHSALGQRGLASSFLLELCKPDLLGFM